MHLSQGEKIKYKGAFKRHLKAEEVDDKFFCRNNTKNTENKHENKAKEHIGENENNITASPKESQGRNEVMGDIIRKENVGRNIIMEENVGRNDNKPQYCQKYLKYNFCHNGPGCSRAHISLRELRKTIKCKHHEKGYCYNKHRCPYKHEKNINCKYEIAGGCIRGDLCEYKHPKKRETIPTNNGAKPKISDQCKATTKLVEKKEETNEINFLDMFREMKTMMSSMEESVKERMKSLEESVKELKAQQSKEEKN